MAAAPSRSRNDDLPEGVQPTAVVQYVEGRIGDDRRQAYSRAGAGLALEATVGRIDVDEHAIRAGDDQPSAREHRTGIVDLTLLRLRPLELRQLRQPADVAIGPGDAQELAVVGDDEHPVARDP